MVKIHPIFVQLEEHLILVVSYNFDLGIFEAYLITFYALCMLNDSKN
jgi:hypothetical protein